MSANHGSRSLFFGIVAVLVLTLLAPISVTAEENEVVALAPVPAPGVADTSVDAVQAAALAAQRAPAPRYAPLPI